MKVAYILWFLALLHLHDEQSHTHLCICHISFSDSTTFLPPSCEDPCDNIELICTIQDKTSISNPEAHQQNPLHHVRSYIHRC
jgi:hypothetical protein